LGLLALGVFVVRSRYGWKLVGQEQWYVRAKQQWGLAQRDRDEPPCHESSDRSYGEDCH
jgi:hypothetical protein